MSTAKAKDAVYGIIRQDDDFGKEVESGYDRAVKEFGVKDGIRLRFKKGTTNFSAEMAQMKQAGVNGARPMARIFAGAANILAEARKLDMNIHRPGCGPKVFPPRRSSPRRPATITWSAIMLRLPARRRRNSSRRRKNLRRRRNSAGVSRYTYVTYIGLKVLAHAMEECGKDLTRACTIEKLRQTKNFDTGGLSAPSASTIRSSFREQPSPSIRSTPRK